jgi:hypothetical protein
MPTGGLGFDLSDHFTHPLPLDSGVQVLPTRQWTEAHRFRLAKPRRVFLGLRARKTLPGSIDPDALKLAACKEHSSRAHAGPVEWARDQVFLATIDKDVAQTADLSGILVADQNVLVSTVPEGASPLVKTPRFLGEVALEVGHELGHLQSRIHGQEKMVVIRQHDAGVQRDSVESLGSAEDPDQQLVEPLAGPQ